MFSRRKPDPATTASTRAQDAQAAHDTESGKGRPTPRRKEAEAANKRPLVPAGRTGSSKSVRAAERASAKVRRDQEYQAMLTGDEKHLPARDRGPVRRYVRDYVDARRTFVEFLLPSVLAYLVLQIVAAKYSAALALIMVAALYLYVIVTVVDVVLLWRGLRKKLRAKFGADVSTQGLLMYTISRISQIRRLRMPKPQVKRGEYPA